MAETVREFFEQVESRLDPARTAGQEASYRFDVEGAGSWHVDVKDGEVAVTETQLDADCVIQAPEDVFLRIINGEANPMTAYMTGKLKVEGNLGLAIKLKEFFF